MPKRILIFKHCLDIIIALLAFSNHIVVMSAQSIVKSQQETVNMLFEKITFKPITKTDFPQLFAWVHTPHVKQWWYPDALPWDQFEAKYLKNLNSDDVHGFIFYLDEKPLGFIQYYDAHKAPDGLGNVEPEGTYGMDLYIGDPEYLGKGYGTQTLRAFLEFIQQRHDVKKFKIDPHPDNIAAIKTYEKIGFKKIREENPPIYGPVVIMEMEL